MIMPQYTPTYPKTPTEWDFPIPQLCPLIYTRYLLKPAESKAIKKAIITYNYNDNQ